MKKIIVGFLVVASMAVWAQDGGSDAAKVKYKEGKKLDFEALLIEGENKKPELSVVTGNSGDRDLGLLKLRENFLDFIADDAGEEVK